MTSEYMRGYIAAMIDGEGCVYYTSRYVGKYPAVQRVVYICNTDQSIIDTCCAYLSELGIGFNVKVKPVKEGGRSKPLIVVSIYKRKCFHMVSQLPLQCQRKVEALNTILDSYIREDLDWDEAQRLFSEEGLSRQQICDQLGVSYASVTHALRTMGHTGKRRVVGSRTSGGTFKDRKEHSPIDMDEARRLYVEGKLSIQKVSQVMGVDHYLLRKAMIEAKFPIRPRGGRVPREKV